MEKFRDIKDVLDCIKYGGWKLYHNRKEVSADWLGSVSILDIDRMLSMGSIMKG